MNYVIRPVSLKDKDEVIRHAQDSSSSLSLPRIPHLMDLKLKRSIENFSSDIQYPVDEFYLFALEDLSTHACVGVSGINSKTGVTEPQFFYKLERIPTTRSLPEMDSMIEILRPIQEYNGPSEVCALYLSENHRKEGLGKLLSFSRFLFMADYPQRFDPVIFANLIGVILGDEETCPFWDSIGRRFCHVDFTTIMARLHYNRSIITSLIPPLPIYISFLDPDVQKMIGQTHPNTAPALHILLNEGFAFTKKIDPFDGGPVIACKLEEIRTIRESKTAEVGTILETPQNFERHLISNRRIDFRCTFGELKLESDGKATLHKDTAQTLEVKAGDSIRFIPLPIKKEKKL